MTDFRLAAGLAIAGMAIGCQPTPQPIVEATAPLPHSTFQQAPSPTLAERLQRADPTLRVGHVDAVAPDVRLASVGGMPIEHFKVGDTITILAGSQSASLQSTVEAIKNGRLQIRYQTPAEGVRQPEKGDLAIGFIDQAQRTPAQP